MRVSWMYWLTIALALGCSSLLRLIDPEPLARLRLVGFDTLQQLQPRAVDPAYPVRIVDIDERSLGSLGEWPWKRELLARLTERLIALGAKVVAFDFVFPQAEQGPLAGLPREVRDAPELQPILSRLAALQTGDQRFTDAISGKPVVLGMIGRAGLDGPPLVTRAGFALLGSDPAGHVPSFTAHTSNAPRFQEAASGLGALNWVPEHDQVVRKVPMVLRLGNSLAPSLVAETMRLYLGAATIAVRSSTASGETPFVQETGITSVRIGQFNIPTDRNGQMWLSFTQQDNGRLRSAVDVVEGRVTRADIAGRIVLVGTSAPGLFDLRATPLDAAIAGVEIHAQALEQILAGSALQRPDLSTGVEVVFAVLSAALLAFLVRRGGAVSGAVVGAATLVLVMGATWWVRLQYGYLLDPTYPALTLTAVYIFSSGFFYFHTARERNRVRRAFNHYMAPSIIEELARRPDKLRLGGENRLVTLYRSDLAGFSALSEQLGPQELVQVMNEYLTAMTDIIMEHGGFVDKYIGDAIDGVFGAPNDDPNHAANAVKAALASCAKLHELNAGGLALGNHKLYQRIGLHTGIGLVGNIGSRQRFNYTVIGDSANLASRLEGTNKVYGTSVLASEATVNSANASTVVWREIDVVRVVGRSEPVRIYEPMGYVTQQSDSKQSISTWYCEGLRRWRSRDFDGAAECFEQVSQVDSPARFFLERSRRFKQNPPPPDWEPVNTLESK